ncbi:MAG: hypothetical protein MnENMB40S_38220 [Rhizobiaceae bacterium MnEN-MB40S]|nr:MAG: hypothetical protein MnENMB40S_38220 [Rhizobiaceae bacterium MnEN-MB40S]
MIQSQFSVKINTMQAATPVQRRNCANSIRQARLGASVLVGALTVNDIPKAGEDFLDVLALEYVAAEDDALRAVLYRR